MYVNTILYTYTNLVPVLVNNFKYNNYNIIVAIGM